MNIFGVGIPEILVVLLLAAVIFGPGRLPEFAAQFGRAIRELREYARDFRDEYLVDFEEMREEYIEVRHELSETDQSIRADLEAAEQDIRLAARDAEAAAEDAVAAARDDGGPAATTAAPARTEERGEDGADAAPTREHRRARRPIVRRRQPTAAEAPARPSNVISLNRRRRDA